MLPSTEHPEQAYADRVPLEHRRRYGQFFTPPEIAELMAAWVAECHPQTALDPGAGTGLLLRALVRRAAQCDLTAIEIDPLVAQLLAPSMPAGTRLRVVQQDFLTWDARDTFDAILANPPYIRHHDLHYPGDIHAEVGQRSSVTLSRLTNIYGLFLLEICRRLRPAGRAAVIVPGEWLNANFGRPLKQYLLENGLLERLIYFSHHTELFGDALTTSCVLLIGRSSSQRRPVQTWFVTPDADVCRLAVTRGGSAAELAQAGIIQQTFSAEQLLAHDKWNSLLHHGPAEIPAGYVTLDQLCTTRRGIATGANEFFHVSHAAWQQAGIDPAHVVPCIGRAKDVAGLVFSRADLVELQNSPRRSCLLMFGERLSAAEQQYLAAGQRAGLDKRYLLAARTPWYRMERRDVAPIWAAVFGRQGLRFVWNRAAIHNLTTFHGIYPQCATWAGPLVACLSSLTIQRLARAQQRVYGGGLLKFEPRDLHAIAVPDVRRMSAATHQRLIDALLVLDQALRSDPMAVPTATAQLDNEVARAARQAQSP